MIGRVGASHFGDGPNLAADQTGFDIFRLKDPSLADLDNLESGLASFRAVALQ